MVYLLLSCLPTRVSKDKPQREETTEEEREREILFVLEGFFDADFGFGVGVGEFFFGGGFSGEVEEF